LACAFDHVIESFRNSLFAGYKSGEGLPEDLAGQFELAERLTAALGVVVWPMVEFEADDALATAAAVLRRQKGIDQIRLCTPDKDLAQCVVGSHVVCWDRKRDVVLDEPGVIAKFGVSPSSIPDYLALVGDRADGIPGIARWGAKAVRRLLGRYGSIEAIPDHHQEWDVRVRGRQALATSLAQARTEALLYRTLATLRTDVPLKVTLETLRWHGPDRELLTKVADELDDPGLVAQALQIPVSEPTPAAVAADGTNSLA
jgi:5'-3' exonuclease